MKVGEIWTHKKDESIQLTILEYLNNDMWKVIYVNTYGDDGSPYDKIAGSVIFKYFYLLQKSK